MRIPDAIRSRRILAACVFTSAAVFTFSDTGAAQARDLTVLTGNDYVDGALYGPFIDVYGRTPQFIFFDFEEDAFDMVDRGIDADIVLTCSAFVSRWLDADLLLPWDTAALPKVTLPDGMAQHFETLADYADYYVPFEYGTTRMIYNAAKVPRGDVADLSVLENEKYRGTIALPAYLDELAALAFLSQGVTAWDAVTETEFQAAIDWLARVHPNVHSYWSDAGALWDLVAEGEVLIAWAWNATYHDLLPYVPHVALAPDATGASTWHCGYGRLAQSQEVRGPAHRFAAATQSAEAGARILSWGSGFPNAEVEDRSGLRIDPEKSGLAVPDGPLLVQTPMTSDLRARFRAAAQKIMAGS
ncbi:MAG: extracellular solute-binding protein [Pseudomonadota bacterium]